MKRSSVFELTDDHKKKRLEWAMRHVHWRTPQWRRIIWTDEASVRLKSKDGRIRVWIKPQDRDKHAVPIVPFGGGTLLIWGATLIGGRSPLHIQKETMNGERYVEVLEKYICPLSFEMGDPSTDWK